MKAKIDSPQTAHELFSVIQHFFSSGRAKSSDDFKDADGKFNASKMLAEHNKLAGELRKAWDVLSALRGPDDQNLQIKQFTTAYIRGALLGINGLHEINHLMVADSHKASIDQDSRHDMEASHFKDHAMKAFAALGLKW